jgi:Cof subfamily protein (haloacid dehalogenase superfamily)
MTLTTNNSNNRIYRLIAFDIDGTILSNEKDVCHKLKDVVKLLKQHGYLFTLVSARFPLSALRISAELGISESALVTLNGSLIINSQHEVLYSKKFSLSEELKNALSMINPNIAIGYYVDDVWYSNKQTHFTQLETKLIGVSYEPRLGEFTGDQVNKITLMGEHEDLVMAKTHLLTLNPSLQALFSHTNYLELMGQGISKFDGLKHYANLHNITMEQIIAFGDGENDISMLENVGLGVAMANAKDHVKAIADDIAGFHYEAGVADYLECLMQKGVL